MTVGAGPFLPSFLPPFLYLFFLTAGCPLPAEGQVRVNTDAARAAEFKEFLPQASLAGFRSTFPIHILAGPKTNAVVFELKSGALPGVCGNKSFGGEGAPSEYSFDYQLVERDQELPKKYYQLKRFFKDDPAKDWGHEIRVDVALMRKDKFGLTRDPDAPRGEFTSVTEWVEFVVRVTSYDYGGSCLVLVFDGGPGGLVETIQAPIDTDGDLLPDLWERLLANGDLNRLDGSTDDEEWPEQPGAKTGDGLTAFEEYRGFFIGGEHFRLHEAFSAFDRERPGGPGAIDLFLHDEPNALVREFSRFSQTSPGPGQPRHPALAGMGAVFHIVRHEEAFTGSSSELRQIELQVGRAMELVPDGLRASGTINFFSPDKKQRPDLPLSKRPAEGELPRRRDLTRLGTGEPLTVSRGPRYAVRVLLHRKMSTSPGTRNDRARTPLGDRVGYACTRVWHEFYPLLVDGARMLAQIKAGFYIFTREEDSGDEEVITARQESRIVARELGARLTLEPVPELFPLFRLLFRDAEQYRWPMAEVATTDPPFVDGTELPDPPRGSFSREARIVRGALGPLWVALTAFHERGLSFPAHPLEVGFAAVNDRLRFPEGGGFPAWRLDWSNRSAEGWMSDDDEDRLRPLWVVHTVRRESFKELGHGRYGGFRVLFHTFTNRVMDREPYYVGQIQWAEWHRDSLGAMRVLSRPDATAR